MLGHLCCLRLTLKTLQDILEFDILGENGFYKVCEMAWAWPSKSFKTNGKLDLCLCGDPKRPSWGDLEPCRAILGPEWL